MLRANRAELCLPPSWRNDYTGAAGELYGIFYPWGLGNAAFHLRDHMLLAMLLDRKLVIVDQVGWLTQHLETLGGTRIVRELPVSLGPQASPSQKAAHSVTRDNILERLERPPPRSVPLLASYIWSYHTSELERFIAVGRTLRRLRPSLRAQLDALLLTPTPPCYALAFVRPAASIRHVLVGRRARCAMHLRTCAGGKAWACARRGTHHPDAAAAALLRCACAECSQAVPLSSTTSSPSPVEVFVAADSNVALRAITTNSARARVGVDPPTSATRCTAHSFLSIGRPAHTTFTRPTEEENQRMMLDWAAFAYAPRVLSLRSSFAPSAVCMFAPHAHLTVHSVAANGSVGACEQPVAGAVGSPHPCTMAIESYINERGGGGAEDVSERRGPGSRRQHQYKRQQGAGLGRNNRTAATWAAGGARRAGGLTSEQ
jgi:hypothetical protein